MKNPMDLTGKSILVYGESSGIDEAIVAKLKELRANVVLLNQMDISLVETVLRQLIKNYGAFDGFVFTLMHSDFRPLQFVKPDIVSGIINDNYSLFVEAMRVLRKSKALKNGASVVALSSISSIRAMKAKMIFCSAKAALDAAIRCLAVELADKRIRVNSIQKGVVDTDFVKGHIQNIASINDGAAEKAAPLGVTKAEEVANIVAFLLSEATRTITGTSIIIDGGYTV